MDNAVTLVEAYLRLNGYFTVAEQPVFTRIKGGQVRQSTDLDLLAMRFPRAAQLVPAKRGFTRLNAPDRALAVPKEGIDCLVVEVKEGLVALNEATAHPDTLRAALARFGCCTGDEEGPLAEALAARGTVTTENGAHVRLVAFGSVVHPGPGVHHIVTLGQVVRFLEEHLRAHWQIYGQAQFGETALGLLALREKVRQAGEQRT